ncbi:LPXTG-motif cell wall anchor domain protein [Beutenbergia cavernae DSM 12333]|uniref:LPXTG-motif cell wall anchor domain protein n=1 Tax=Beutenbergia cavernae (strain ATCC BAA-8 / DSM 12333 / CCUG 43141 / JCM 11478 / NBRC 16432 / NCIMB 13614 / HKI 0122) TaxID=471853 RepID=C5C273_BEUC1|nr:trypsin-like serine protease [Beutenbergia cavernae]ACQ81698.1 LPXTG-motif cell wall anchor domain protein [Beutenbergia cavernae DSM 12333]
MSTPSTIARRLAATGAVATLSLTTVLATSAFSAPADEPAAPAATESTDGATAGQLAPGIEEALGRDLGITYEEFVANGDLAAALDAALPALQEIDVTVSGALVDGEIVVYADAANGDLTAAVQALGGRVEVRTDAQAPADDDATTSPEPTDVPEATEPATFDAVLAEVNGSSHARTFAAGSSDSLWAQGVTAVTVDAAGQVTVAHSGESVSPEVEARLEAFTGITFEQREVAQPLAQDQIVGGAGFAAGPDEDGFYALCSVGFPAFDGSRDNPAIITAGHCTHDDAANPVVRTVPSADDAAFYPDPSPQPELWDDLGEYVASQFGGPGHAPGVAGTDGALMEVTNSALSLLPRVSDWTTEADDDLAASGPDVRSTAHATIGADTCRSGRTTGWHCGEILEEGVYQVGGHNYPADPNDIRLVRGFATLALADQGDSGGSFISGTTAVGVLSAGGEFDDGTPYTIAAHLDEVLETVAPNAEVVLLIDVPTVTTTGDVQTGAAITGTGVAGDTIVVTPTTGAPFEVTVAGNGTWSFSAPAEEGAYTFTVQAVRSLNQSEVSEPITVNVVEAPLAAPAITSPADGATVTEPVAAITGTGVAGATVTLGGDVTGEATVEANGSWSFAPAEALSYGTYEITASQAVEDQTSPEAAASFTVAPVAPTITAPTAGEYAQDELPTAVTGTGIDGAEVTVLLNGQPLEAPEAATDVASTFAAVTDGAFSVALPTLAPGEHTVTATQTINGVTSVPTEVVLTVLAAEEPAPDGELPETGSNDAGLLIGIAASLVVAGGLTVVVRRRIGQRG